MIWEPTASRIVLEKLARKVATGAAVNERDGGFMVMDFNALIQIFGRRNIEPLEYRSGEKSLAMAAAVISSSY